MIYAIHTQARVIWALILKEILSINKNQPLGIIWALIEPLLHILGWIVFVTLFRQKALIGDSVITFIATGLLPIITFQKIYTAMMIALISNKQLVKYAPVHPNDTIIAKFILQTMISLIAMIVIFYILIQVGESDLPHDILRCSEGMFYILFMAFGFGIFAAYFSEVSIFFGRFISIIGRCVYFLSGIFFIPDMLPRPIKDIVWYNPLAHAIEIFRSGYYASFESSMPVPLYMVSWAVVLTLAGLMFSSFRQAKGRYL